MLRVEVERFTVVEDAIEDLRGQQMKLLVNLKQSIHKGRMRDLRSSVDLSSGCSVTTVLSTTSKHKFMPGLVTQA